MDTNLTLNFILVLVLTILYCFRDSDFKKIENFQNDKTNNGNNENDKENDGTKNDRAENEVAKNDEAENNGSKNVNTENDESNNSTVESEEDPNSISAQLRIKTKQFEDKYKNKKVPDMSEKSKQNMELLEKAQNELDIEADKNLKRISMINNINSKSKKSKSNNSKANTSIIKSSGDYIKKFNNIKSKNNTESFVDTETYESENVNSEDINLESQLVFNINYMNNRNNNNNSNNTNNSNNINNMNQNNNNNNLKDFSDENNEEYGLFNKYNLPPSSRPNVIDVFSSTQPFVESEIEQYKFTSNGNVFLPSLQIS